MGRLQGSGSARQLKAGQTVLVHGGSGGVGHFAVQFAKAKGARVLTTVSTDNVDFARKLGADVVIDYKKPRFEDEASGLDMVFDLIDGETRERSWKLLKKGGVLVTTLTDPSQDKAREHGVRATRYTVEADGTELAKLLAWWHQARSNRMFRSARPPKHWARWKKDTRSARSS